MTEVVSEVRHVVSSPGDDSDDWVPPELEDPRLTIGSRAKSGKVSEERERDSFDWQQHRPNLQEREDDRLSECHWRRAQAQFPSPPRSNNFPRQDQPTGAHVRSTVGPHTPPSPRPPTPKTPSCSPPSSPRPNYKSLSSFSLSALGKMGRPKRTTRESNVPVTYKKKQCSGGDNNNDAEVTIPCPMCRDVSVKLEQYFDHLTRLHKVTNGDFLKRLYRWTKREMEVSLDQQSLFHPSDNRSERLTKEFAKVTKNQLCVRGSSQSSHHISQKCANDSTGSSERASKDKDVRIKQHPRPHDNNEKRSKKRRSSASTETAPDRKVSSPAKLHEPLSNAGNDGSESHENVASKEADNDQEVSKSDRKIVCTKFSCTECPYCAVSSVEVCYST